MIKSGKQAKIKGGLAESPSHLMHRALQLALDIYAEEAGPDGLTQTDLVRATGIDRSTLADLVARMTTKGLLERERSTLDARAKAVRLSPEGEAALLAARPRVEAADKRIMGLLPKSKRDSFLDLLCSLSDAADAAPEQARADIKAAKKAAKDAKKAEKAARKGDGKTDGRGKKKKKGEPVVEQPQADDAADADVVPLKDAAEG